MPGAGCRGRAPRFYEIPITLSARSHRKPMRQVSPRWPQIRAGPKAHSIDRSQPAFPEALGTCGNTCEQEQLMLDIAMLALGLGFFVLGIGYAYACERL
jgi:hypothetical protein